ncbi:MAG TPA: amidase, partial [Terriglobia bacterium]|nr:amidase [Terriglobia bacterium]
MSTSRRDFVALGSLGLLGTAIAPSVAQTPETKTPVPPPGSPTAFGTAPPAGPEITPDTFRAAEKLVEVDMNPVDLEEAAGNWRRQMAPLYERRVGPRKVALEDTLNPATQWNPMLPGITPAPNQNRFERSLDPHLPLPADEEVIAYAPVAQLSRWIESRELTSEQLTKIYLGRMKRFNPALNCIITLTAEHALAQARAAD